MHPSFMAQYLRDGENSPQQKQLLYITNPNKYLWCEFLIRFHESRGDKVRVLFVFLF